MRELITSRFTSVKMLREGSVGLLILLGVFSFGAILLWLNGVSIARSSYKFVVEFANAGGMQKGATVRYRGVKVGKISDIRPKPNAIEVEIQIAPSDLIIPRDVKIDANQSGLISESIVDITPKSSLLTSVKTKPLDRNCDSSLIVCNGSRLNGQIGISVDDLIRSSSELATLYNDPKFYQRVNRLLESSAAAATSVAALSQDLRGLTKGFQGQLGTFGTTANSIKQATNQLTISTSKTANQFGVTAQEFGFTANKASRLLTNLDNLLTSNRSSLVGALNNITQTSNQLRVTVTSLSPALNRLTQGEVIKNLETLSANAAQASANLRDATQALNDPKTVVLLQQTLDSARLTFENTQKITSDLDGLTGDSTFRENLRQLVNGLSGLVSSTQQMQQQVQLAATLNTIKLAAKKSDVLTPTAVAIEQTTTNPLITVVKGIDKETESNNSSTSIVNSSQEKLLQQLREHRVKRESEPKP